MCPDGGADGLRPPAPATSAAADGLPRAVDAPAPSAADDIVTRAALVGPRAPAELATTGDRQPTLPDVRGLTTAEVAERVARGQDNRIATKSSRSTWTIIRVNVFTRFNAILGVLCVLMLIVGKPQDALFGLAIVANTAIGIVQEIRAKHTLDRLSLVGRAKPTVRRDGTDAAVDQEDVVVDDVVVLGSGDTLVVDGVVLTSVDLEIDESLLTGESDPVLKNVGDEALSGSFVGSGSGTYRVTKVGAQAYAASLAADAGQFNLVGSQLRDGINRFLRVVQWLLIPAAALLVYSQLTSDESLTSALQGAVAGTVTMIPEGLVLLTSVAFAVGVVRLGRRQTLVQELAAVEGLARVDVVCADKTGTLTEDRMTLAEVQLLEPATAAGMDAAYVDAALGAVAAADPHPNASLQAIADAKPPPAGWRVTDTTPFSSARKWSSATFADQDRWILGAPDILLQPGDPALAAAAAPAKRGQRVLLLAQATQEGDGIDGVRPIALVVLDQTIRPDAEETLRYFERQNVAVKVISGDAANTVGSVATRLALPGADHPVDARTLPTDQADLAKTLDGASVFGRVTPQQKRSMVDALKSNGHVVAMTGDGVNDVLALKDADIGVAMGSGSDASRAVARIVLLDNKFASLPYVVAEGRRVIGNIERVANLFLTKTFYALTLVLLVGVASLPFPFLPRHLTLIGTLTIGVPAFFLALAPNTDRARSGLVKRVLRLAIPAGLVAALTSFASYGLARVNTSSDLGADRTAAVITLFMVTVYLLLLVARPLVWWKVALVAAMVAGFLIAISVPFLRTFFALEAGEFDNDLLAVGIGLLGCVVLHIVLLLVGSLPRRRGAAHRA